MVSVQDRIFTSPLRTQNKLPSHIIASFNTPPVSNFERLSFISPDRSKLPSKPSSPNPAYNSPESSGGDLLKRGRPKAAMIHTLINKGHSVESSIRCRHCSRVFPREKSLAAHMRTHTGERPYTCDYPNCFKAFCQSGQLKTHQRLHSGEKPFVCSAKDCRTRFTHSNRHCPDHPSAGLLRDEKHSFMPEVDAECSKSVKEWLKRYYSNRHDRTPYKHRVTSPPPSTTKRSLFGSPEMIHERENTTPPSTSNPSPSKDIKYAPLDSHTINEIINGEPKSKNNMADNKKDIGASSAVKSESDLNNNNNYIINNNQIYSNNFSNITPNEPTSPNRDLIDFIPSPHHDNHYSSCLGNSNILQQHKFNYVNNNINKPVLPPQQNFLFTENFDSNLNTPIANVNNLALFLNNNNDNNNNNNIIIPTNNINAIISNNISRLSSPPNIINNNISTLITNNNNIASLINKNVILTNNNNNSNNFSTLNNINNISTINNKNISALNNNNNNNNISTLNHNISTLNNNLNHNNLTNNLNNNISTLNNHNNISTLNNSHNNISTLNNNHNNNAILSDDSTTLREEVVVEESLKDDTFKGAMALLELANGFPTHRVIG